MKKVITILLLWTSIGLKGQDLVYTQNFGSPYYLNPAFAGKLAKTSFYLNARQQWPSISGSYTSSSFSASHQLSNINSGVGLIIKQDDQGSARHVMTNIAGIYSYNIHLNKEWSLSPAIQVSYINSRFDQGSFVFGDQINDDFSISRTVKEDISFRPFHAVDFSTGGIIYNKNAWFGATAHHLSEPKNYIGPGTSLNRKYAVHGGYAYIIDNTALAEPLTISPSLGLQYQAPFMRVGMNLIASYHYFSVGSGVVNITSSFDGANILNAFALIGYSDEHFKIGYSYDFTVRGAAGLGGAHEISLGVWLNYDNNSNRKPLKHKKIRKVSCPKF